MKAIVYQLRLLEPMLIAQAGAGEENSAIGLSYIPGSALRGALVARWLTEHPDVDLAADPMGRAWFLDGTICYLNAYLEYDGKRTLPKPASWMTEKDTLDDPESPIFDLAIDAHSNLKTPKPPTKPFCRLERIDSDEVWSPVEYRTVLVSPLRYEQVHITLENANRRGEDNQVFRYDALASGQVFGGVIVAPDGYDLGELKRLLEAGDLMLGTAHLAGYGRAAVESIYEQKDWREYQPNEAASNGNMVVTLLSHTILQGAGGQAGWDDGQTLARSLGFSESSRPMAVFGRTELIGGYNRKWSLPLPQAWALTAGSVFVFGTQDIDSDTLRAAMKHGIGDRRVEGFGRIAVNWQAVGQLTQEKADVAEFIPPPLSSESREQARVMAQRRLRLTLDRELARRVTADADRLRKPPTNAQLAAIRQATLTGLSQKQSLQLLLDYLTNLKETGKSQLRRCRLDNESLLDWLQKRAKNLDVKEQLLGKTPLPRVAGEAASLDDNELRVEYTARLIDGVMQLTARRNKEEKR